MQPKYDQASPQSIEAFGKRLVNGTLRTVEGARKMPLHDLKRKIGTGGKSLFGALVEEYYYDIHPGNASLPDFPEAGVELKTTPVKRLQSSEYSAKERLVLGIINYITEKDKTFESSSFYTKNSKLMVISYVHQDDTEVGDLSVKMARLIEFEKLPAEDQKIIREDWEKIAKKIREGKAHEISEGDTLYLGACTKSDTSATLRAQIGAEKAKPRAYSFKGGYMTALIRRDLEGVPSDDERAVKHDEEKKPQTFEEIVVSKFDQFLNKTVEEIAEILKSDINMEDKANIATLARRMMGVKGKEISEFEAAEVSMKTVRLEMDGKPEQHMSFPAFKFKEIINQRWDSEDGELIPRAEFRNQIEKRFFLVVFQRDKSGDQRLKKVMFWTMPYEDMLEAEKVWKAAARNIRNEELDHLPGITENRVAHVRPHGRDGDDLDETQSGNKKTKQCFWLRNTYIASIVK